MKPVKLLAVSWGGEVSPSTFRRAAILSRERRAELYIAHIWNFPLSYVPEFIYSNHCEKQEEEAGRLMEAAVETVEAAGGLIAQTYVRLGFPENEVARLSREIGVDVVILGKQRRGVIKRLLVGSTADRIARRTSCPVVFVEQEEPLASPA